MRLLTAIALFATTLMPLAVPAAHAEGLTKVVYVGGIDSSPAGNAANMAPLISALVTNYGYQRTDFLQFSYGGNPGAYTASATCQPIDSTEAQLAGYLRSLRDGGAADHVILVGHSLGGVLAFDLMNSARDLFAGGFVRELITVDSPLGGISASDNSWAGIWYGDCPVLNDLAARQSWGEGWRNYLSSVAGFWANNGTVITAVDNVEDLAVTDAEQVIPYQKALNFSVDATDSGFNHSALFRPENVGVLAQVVGAKS